MAGKAAKFATLRAALAGELGAAPRGTELDGKALTPRELAATVLGDAAWTEYDVARHGAGRVGPSDDPDARPGTTVHYVDLSTAVALIHESLAQGQAVVWGSTDNHALLIYGGDYDANGRPIDYWVKDSFAPYTYRAPAATIHRILTDVTVAVSPRDAAPVAAHN